MVRPKQSIDPLPSREDRLIRLDPKVHVNRGNQRSSQLAADVKGGATTLVPHNGGLGLRKAERQVPGGVISLFYVPFVEDLVHNFIEC